MVASTGAAAMAVTSSLSADSGGLDALRRRASSDPKAAVAETARQFEALLLQEMLKSVRESSTNSSLLGSDESTSLGRELLDNEWAQRLSGSTGGLAAYLAKAMSAHLAATGQDGGTATGASGGAAASVGSISTSTATGVTATASTAVDTDAGVSTRLAGFVQRNVAAARKAEQLCGVPAAYMLAQAGHETAWGSREIKRADGSSANNFFGIKATSDWKGDVAETTTTEYVGGVARKVVQRFRAYASADESFADYAGMVSSKQRYAPAVAAAQAGDARGFARGLQDAGYATDPAYAAKIERSIRSTQRVSGTNASG